MSRWYPLLFSEIFREKVWGGRGLEQWCGKRLPPGAMIGESWEISGCTDAQSRVANGPLRGKALGELTAGSGEALTGAIPPSPLFPLLYKFIDANDNLSIQLHPDDGTARRNGWGPNGKTECWYIVHARPGAQLVMGFVKGATREDIARGARDGTLDTLLNYIPVSRGDVVFVPAGTVHAICAGIVLYELQETSDTTLRLYDWGRNDPARPLHIDESLPVMDLSSHSRHRIPPVVMGTEHGVSRAVRAACRYFALEEYRLEQGVSVSLPPKRSFQVITILSGSCTVAWDEGEISCDAGRSVLLPAELNGAVIRARAAAEFLLSSVPAIREEIIGPLRSAGIGDESIAALGGNPRCNDIIPLL